MALAELLLRDERRWTRDVIRESMARGERKVVPLDAEVPVYLTYFTAWVDGEGKVHFRDDLYGVDGNERDSGVRDHDPVIAHA